jgi:SAM-dependent methyltransferase
MRIAAGEKDPMTSGHAPGSDSPSDWVVRWAHLVRAGGTVLDLACGSGRHARFFAARGNFVTACDRDSAALAGISGIPGISTREADLEDGSPWPFSGMGFDAVVVTNYLHRPLFPVIAAALSPGGVLIYETFVLGNERYGKPSNPRFLLRRDELLEAFGRGLVVAGFEQGRTSRAKAALIQRLCALRAERLDNDLEPTEAPDSVKILG